MASGSLVTVAGITLSVLADSAYLEEPALVGGEAYGDDGSPQTSERTPKRRYAVVAKFTPSGFTTFLAAVSVTGEPGVPKDVTVTSPADGLTQGATLTARVRVGRTQLRARGTGTAATTALYAPLAIREV